MQLIISKWHSTPSVIKLTFLYQYNPHFTIWPMATCHPHVISVFFIGLILNAITINSQSRPGGKKKHKHVQLNLYFWRLLLHFYQLQWVNFAACTQRPVMITGEFIRGIGQNWGKMWYFLQNYLCQLYLYYFAIVVIINKAFKLFNLVLVVYCDSCCHWWYPGNSAGQKNVYNTL